MGLKETLKQKFSKPKDITLERYRASKFTFVMSSFLFFLNYYFVGANFHETFFIKTLGIIYMIMLLSIVFFVYFYAKNTLSEKVPNYVFTLMFIILLIMFSFLALPVVVEGGLNGIIDSIM